LDKEVEFCEMKTQESEFQSLYGKFLDWQTSQEHQTDGHEYERSFVKFCRLLNKEILKIAMESVEEKKVITSFGTMEVGRSHCLCPCKGREGFRTSPYLQELACYVGQSVPFDEGSELLAKLNGISLTDKQTVRRCDRAINTSYRLQRPTK
jgi:hypothetical protein